MSVKHVNNLTHDDLRYSYANYVLIASRKWEYKMSDIEEDLALIGLHFISEQKRIRSIEQIGYTT